MDFRDLRLKSMTQLRPNPVRFVGDGTGKRTHKRRPIIRPILGEYAFRPPQLKYTLANNATATQRDKGV